jgi:MscS family membrane protein
MDITKKSGTSFAFPSQTSYLCRDGGLDEEATLKAEDEVGLWRKEAKLPFPILPSDKIEELENTLDYPPVGSYSEVTSAEPGS